VQTGSDIMSKANLKARRRILDDLLSKNPDMTQRQLSEATGYWETLEMCHQKRTETP